MLQILRSHVTRGGAKGQSGGTHPPTLIPRSLFFFFSLFCNNNNNIYLLRCCNILFKIYLQYSHLLIVGKVIKDKKTKHRLFLVNLKIKNHKISLKNKAYIEHIRKFKYTIILLILVH